MAACGALAQVGGLDVGKMHAYQQTSAAGLSAPQYQMSVAVHGTNTSSIAAPVLTGPFPGSRTLSYNGFWSFNSFFTSQAQLDSNYPDGTYTVVVNGAGYSFPINGSAYPNAPIFTLSGGAWVGGKYVIDPGRALSLATNAFAAYGAGDDASIHVYLGPGVPFNLVDRWQYRSSVGANTVSFTIPAGTMEDGREYYLAANFRTHLGQRSSPLNAYGYYGAITNVAVKAERPQVFPMSVTSNITPAVANATATFQPRPQEAGTTQSVFVFAVAPRDLVRPSPSIDPMPPLAKARGKGGEAKADAVACVLAQLNAAGQLVAVSSQSLQAFVTAALSAQGQSVTLLNNVPTINVAGATFYLGYGANGPAMIASGVNNNALTVPGARECKPQPPQTGWWWDPPPSAGARSPRDGTGYSIEAQGNALFFAGFLYDASGRASWYVASGRTSIDGSLFTGDLLQASGGQALGGAYRPFSSVTNAGPITIAFDSATSGTMVWPGGTVPLGRFDIVPNGRSAQPRSNEPESGWWWNPQENGRGFFIEWQDGTADLAGYMYDDAGNPIWYITVVPTPDPMRLAGNWLQFGNGMTLTGAWRAHELVNGNVAPVSITFTSATTAVMTLPNGRTTNLVRHRF